VSSPKLGGAVLVQGEAGLGQQGVEGVGASLDLATQAVVPARQELIQLLLSLLPETHFKMDLKTITSSYIYKNILRYKLQL